MYKRGGVMGYPVVEIYREKIKENAQNLVKECHLRGIEVAGVVKVFGGYKDVVEAYIDGGVDLIADSRIENLKGFNEFNIPKMLIRIPMKSQAEEVVKYSDVALVSEIDIVEELNKYAKKYGKIYDVILMIDVGDLREGIFFKNKKEIEEWVRKVDMLKYVNLKGIGTNLNCYGGVIPSAENMNYLVEVKLMIEKLLDRKLDVISGGNSENIKLMRENGMPKEINQLRIGVGIALGIGLYDRPIEGQHTDTVKLIAEVVEVKEKPSAPIGEVGIDAFGRKPTFIDKGIRRRAILGIGRQDVSPEHIVPIDNKIEIIGASSDHLIIDITESNNNYKCGDVVEFNLTYGGLLAAMTSKYVNKRIV